MLAQEEARLLNHNYIGTEHLLLGLIHEGDGVAAHALVSMDSALETTRARVEAIIGHGGQSPSGHIPFTPRAKKVLELSLREALQLGHNYIGTEHILLGMIREGEGVAAQVLQGMGADLARVRQRVVQMLSDPAFVPSEAGTLSFPLALDTLGPVRCGYCSTPSPACGALFTGPSGVLICERCVADARAAQQGIRVARGPVASFGQTVVFGTPDPPEVTGPPPDDEGAAREAVIDIFLRRMELSDDGESLPNVLGGENLGPCRQEVMARFGGIAARTTTTVERVQFLNDHEAVVWWTVALDGRPILGTLQGRLVLVDGQWKATRETVCGDMGRAGVQCPPPPGSG